jgi:hypothetical protein
VIPGNDAKRASKTKFECASCGQIAQGKPNTNIICGHCHPFECPRMLPEAVSYDQKDPNERALFKTTVLGAAYGMRSDNGAAVP